VAFAAASRLADLPHLPAKTRNFERRRAPEQRALCRLLTYVVGSYIEAFDEEPLPVAIADRAYQRTTLTGNPGRHGPVRADHRLADLNRVAACHLWH
jgi:hypothetical protein